MGPVPLQHGQGLVRRSHGGHDRAPHCPSSIDSASRASSASSTTSTFTPGQAVGAAAAADAASLARPAAARATDPLDERQRDGEGRALALPRALGLDGAAVQLDQVAGDGQAQAEAPVLARARGVGLAEVLEDVRQEVGTDPAARCPSPGCAPAGPRGPGGPRCGRPPA